MDIAKLRAAYDQRDAMLLADAIDIDAGESDLAMLRALTECGVAELKLLLGWAEDWLARVESLEPKLRPISFVVDAMKMLYRCTRQTLAACGARQFNGFL